MPADAPATDKSNFKWRGVIGLVVIAAGIGMAWYGYHIRQLAAASQSWLTATGRVLKSHVAEERRRNQQNHLIETEYHAKVDYEYHVNGVRYEGKRIRFTGSPSTDVRSTAQAVVDRYPVGATIDVYYDPLNPTTAVLDRTFSPLGVGVVIGMGLCAVLGGLALLVWARVTSYGQAKKLRNSGPVF